MPRKSAASAEDDWQKHGYYDEGVSFNRVVTRSQTGFNRTRKSTSERKLFVDGSKHDPPNKPHLMQVMKGEMGAVPNTIILRRTGEHLKTSEQLCKKLEPYKKFTSEDDSNKTRSRKSKKK